MKRVFDFGKRKQMTQSLSNPCPTFKQVEEQFQHIADIAIDYDGYRRAEDLMKLIDELRDMALEGVRMVQEEEQRESDTLLHKKGLCEIDFGKCVRCKEGGIANEGT